MRLPLPAPRPDGAPSAAWVELPLTAAMRATLRRSARASYTGAVLAGGVVIALLVTLVQAGQSRGRGLPGRRHPGLGHLGALVGLAHAIRDSRDLLAGSYIQASGPMRAAHREKDTTDGAGGATSSHDYELHLSCGPLKVSRGVYRALRDETWAVIEYTPIGVCVFAAHDRAGRVLYRRPGYAP